MSKVYCVKCRTGVEPKDATEGPIVWTCKKTGKEMRRNGVSGTCPTCSKKVKQFRKGTTTNQTTTTTATAPKEEHANCC